MMALEGASIGFQLGGQATDFVLLVMNPRGARSILSSKVKLGADASAAAGPKGRNAEAATDVTLRAEVLIRALADCLPEFLSRVPQFARITAQMKSSMAKSSTPETSFSKVPFRCRLPRRRWLRTSTRSRPRTCPIQLLCNSLNSKNDLGPPKYLEGLFIFKTVDIRP